MPKVNVKFIVAFLALIIFFILFICVFNWVESSYNYNKTLSKEGEVRLNQEITKLKQLSKSLDKQKKQRDKKQLGVVGYDERPGVLHFSSPALTKEMIRKKIEQEIRSKEETREQIKSFFYYVPEFPILLLGVISIILTRVIIFLTDLCLNCLVFKLKKEDTEG